MSCCDLTLSQKPDATAKIYSPSVTLHLKISIWTYLNYFLFIGFLMVVIALQNQGNQFIA
jgi:hypothetical protein